jgi:hypothetical protein
MNKKAPAGTDNGVDNVMLFKPVVSESSIAVELDETLVEANDI